METWRKHRFTQGKSYKLLKSVRSQTSEFEEGERVQFESTAYSPYDSSTAFVFKACSGGELKTWFLHDDDPDESISLFAEV